MSDLTAQLEQLGLTALQPDASNPQTRWAFEAAGALVRPDGVVIDHELRLGLGRAPGPAPVDAVAISLDQVAELRDTRAMWVASGYDALASGDPPSQPVWLAVLSTSGVELSAAIPIPPRTNGAAPLEAPQHFTFVDPLVLRVHVRVASGVMQALEATLEGLLTVRADLGPVQLASSPGGPLAGSFALALEAFEGVDLGGVLANPASLLDGEFRGALTVEFTPTQPVRMLDAQFTGTQTIRIHLQVASPASSRLLVIESVTYDHQLAGALRIGGPVAADIKAASFHAELSNWSLSQPGTFVLTGSGDITLPARLTSVLAGGTSSVAGQFGIRHEPGPGTLDVELSVDQLRLANEMNPLGLTPGSLRVALQRSSAAVWSVSVTGAVDASWNLMAQNLREARIVSLPAITDMPDVAASFRLELGQTTTLIALDLALVDPTDLTSPRDAYVGMLGPLPIRIGGGLFTLAGTRSGTSWTWTAAGQTRVTTMGELARVVPIAELAATFRLTASTEPNAIPELLIEIGTGLPPLTLPSLQPRGPRLEVVRLTRLAFRLGGDIKLEADTTLLANLNAAAASLGLPNEWNPIVRPLVTAVSGSTGKATFVLPLQPEGAARIEVEFSANPNAQPLDVFGALAAMAPWAAPAPGNGATSTMPLSKPLLTLRPSTLRFAAELPASGDPALFVAATAICTVLDETFDATLRISYSGGAPELSLLAGTIDPIRIAIPAPQTVPSDLDQKVQQIIGMYQIPSNSAGAILLRDLAARIRAMFDAADAQELMAFEITNLGFTVRLAAGQDPLTVTGGVRIVKFPPIFALIFEGPSPTVTLGSSGTSVFIELSPAPAAGGQPQPSPLVRIPVSEHDSVSVMLHSLRLGYGWAPPAFELSLDADVAVPPQEFRGGIGLLLPAGTARDASASMGVQIKLLPGAPVPTLDWNMRFFPQSAGAASRGLELVLGASRTQRFVTVYLRETVLNPTYFLLMPGLKVDCGVIFGTPPEQRNPNNPADFFFEIVVGGATMVLINPVIGIMMNPLAAVPPFFTANPPFWVIPGLLMGDLFTDESGVRGFEIHAKIPAVIEFDFVLKRPLPNFTLPMLFEIAALVAQGFTVELPASSSLRNLFYAGIAGSIRIPVLETLFGEGNGSLAASIEFNLVEIINVALRLLADVRKFLEDSAQALGRAQAYVAQLLADPELAVRMVPKAQRRISADSQLQALGLGLQLNFSAYLLLPEEIEDELRMFHENKRKVGKGVGALKGAPPRGPVLDNPFVESGVIDRGFDFLGNPLGFLSPRAVAGLRATAERDTETAIAARLEPARERLLDGFAESVAESLVSATPAERNRLVQRFKLDRVKRQVDDISADLRRTPEARRRESSALIREPLRQLQGWTVEIRRKLDERPDVIARRMAEAIVKPVAAGRLGQPVGLEILSDRKRVFRQQIKGIKLGGDKLSGELEGAVGRVAFPRQATDAEVARLRSQLAVELEAAIVRNQVIASHADLNASTLAPSISKSFTGTFDLVNTKAQVGKGLSKNRVFDAVLVRENWLGFLPGRAGASPPRAAPTETEEAKGFEIAIRSANAHLARNWSVETEGPNSAFRVEFQEGKYWLTTRGAAGVAVRVALPVALVGAVPPGPKRARRLAEMLELRKRLVKRPLTHAEIRYSTEEPFETVSGLYKKSIFFSPEFEIRGEGGRRGPTYVADLLRKPDGTYIVPKGITAMAGCLVRVLTKSTVTGGLKTDFLVRMCGLASTGGHLLLFGHTRQTLEFGPLNVVLEGDFHLAVGNVATVAIGSGQTIRPDSLSFRGFGQVIMGGSELLRSDASGSIVRRANGRIELELHVKTHVAFQHEIVIGGVKLVKVWLDADAEFNLVLGRKVHADAAIDIDLSYAFGEFETETIKVDVTTCVPFTTICTRVEVEMEVPNPVEEMTWGSTHTIGGSLAVTFDSGASQVLQARVTANVPLPDGNTHALSLALPDFVNAVL